MSIIDKTNIIKKKMNLLQLRYFQAVCLYGTVTKAAEAMNISQPSISLAIKELEDEFSLPLFKRQYRGMTLTDPGKKLLNLSKELLDQADSLRRIMEEMGEKRHILRIGIGPMIGSVLLPSLFKHYFIKHPELNIQISENARSISLNQLNNDEIDMLFLAHSGALDEELHSIKVMSIDVVCCLSPQHRLAEKEKISFKDLEDENIVLFSDSFYQTELIKSRFHGAGVKPNIIFQSSQVSTIMSMIKSNLAIGFLLSPMLKNEKEIKSIVLSPPLKEEVSLVWKNDSYPFKEKERFMKYIKTFKL